MSANTDAMVAYYVRLLIFEYQLPRAQQMIASFVNQIVMNGLPETVQNAFNVKTAVGAQLDVLGKYIGLPRTVGDPAPLPYFGFVTYAGGGNPHGFTNYDGSTNTDAVFFEYNYQGQRNTALSDASYSFLMALKIILNSSDGTLYSIQKYLDALLPGLVTVVDNKDMTLTYSVYENAPVSPSVLRPYLPKPMGVGVNITTFSFLIADNGDKIITDSGDHIIIPGF